MYLLLFLLIAVSTANRGNEAYHLIRLGGRGLKSMITNCRWATIGNHALCKIQFSIKRPAFDGKLDLSNYAPANDIKNALFPPRRQYKPKSHK